MRNKDIAIKIVIQIYLLYKSIANIFYSYVYHQLKY